MTNWPEIPPPTPEQVELFRRLQTPIPEDELARFPRPSIATDPEEAYRQGVESRRANPYWRKLLRFYYRRFRYLCVRAWVKLTRPWEEERRIRRLQVYADYFKALKEYEEAQARRAQAQEKES